MLDRILGRTEAVSGRGASWRDALPAAEKTEPPAGLLRSVVKKMPVERTIEHAIRASSRANDRVVTAQGDLHRAEFALEQLRVEHAALEEEHMGYVRKHTAALAKALEDRDQAHAHFLNESKNCGALEGCRYVDFKSMPQKKDDDDRVPTVRLETE